MATNPTMLSGWLNDYLKAKPQAATYNASTAQATEWQPTADATVQGQVARITDAGGPLMERAATTAKQGMARRGLLNSSMAIGAGQSALYDAALPMATQDASTYATALRDNAVARNSTSQFNATAANQAGQFNAGATNDATAQQAQIGGQAGLQEGQQVFTAGQSALDRAQQTALQESQQRFTAGENQATRQFTSGESALDRTLQTDLQTGQQRFTADQNTTQREFQGTQANLDRTQQTALQREQIAAQERQQVTAHAQTLEQMGYQSKLANAKVPESFAATIAQNSQTQINAIMGDPNLDEKAKKAAIDNVVNYTNATLTWAEKMYGVDLPSLGVPGAAPTPSAAPPVPPPSAASPISPGRLLDGVYEQMLHPGGA